MEELKRSTQHSFVFFVFFKMLKTPKIALKLCISEILKNLLCVIILPFSNNHIIYKMHSRPGESTSTLFKAFNGRLFAKGQRL